MPTTDPTHTSDRSVHLADHLAPTRRNLASAARAVAALAAPGWEPRSGYPGSNTPWPVRCRLCGWEGLRFYSRLRRQRSAFRHPGCLCAARLAELTGQAPAVCTCIFWHPTTPRGRRPGRGRARRRTRCR